MLKGEKEKKVYKKVNENACFLWFELQRMHANFSFLFICSFNFPQTKYNSLIPSKLYDSLNKFPYTILIANP